ncbi:MAG: geranylgeranylglyceryl/heptaprenylglyceryl phosphate synthase [Bacteroidota bacterium]
MKVYEFIKKRSESKQKTFALLVDPSKTDAEKLRKIGKLSDKAQVDVFFVGGSILFNDQLKMCLKTLRENSKIPVVLFPGNNLQIDSNADAILFLSLISGRNPEMLIGKHVVAAPYVKAAKLEAIPTGYMLIESGKLTTAHYMSNSLPIPSGKSEIAACTALAGEMLGMKLIYMDAGSGAERPVPTEMITAVKKEIQVPLIIGGGLRKPQDAANACKAGADMIVVGTAFEENPSLIQKFAEAIHK